MDKRCFIIGKDEIPSKVVLGKGESLHWTFASLPGTSGMTEIEIDIDAPDCEVDLAGIFLCTGNEDLSIKVLVRHNAGGSISRQLFKGIAGGSAKADFSGLIYVKEDAQKTKAYQSCHTILLSPDARVEARPQLEIHADDVECSHGATSGYLNPEELFYMRSRGIPEDEARRLQIQSFIAPVLSRLEPELQEKILEGLE